MIAIIQVEFPIPNAVYVFTFKANESQELIELAKAQFKKHRIETYLSKETMVIRQNERDIMFDDSEYLIKEIAVNAKQVRKIINRDKYFKNLRKEIRMSKKNISPLRKDFIFTDGRKDKHEIFSSLKGYATEDGVHVGLTILYNIKGELDSIGNYTMDLDTPGSRRIGHWKFFGRKNEIKSEIIYIK